MGAGAKWPGSWGQVAWGTKLSPGTSGLGLHPPAHGHSEPGATRLGGIPPTAGDMPLTQQTQRRGSSEHGLQRKYLFFSKKKIFSFLQRRGDRDRQLEASMRERLISCLLHTPHWGCAPNRGICP
uniref:Uncharacterized protein n=1 Tax=Pipistrellus kuhlii TaxID=59472 RepID=A0A7J8A8Q3_PIPKU|nr:hypothetical protein mPipKuh1_008908 [Pipistrellus kuhlii]